MIHWLWLIPAFMFGGFVGVLIMALMSVSSRGDEND